MITSGECSGSSNMKSHQIKIQQFYRGINEEINEEVPKFKKIDRSTKAYIDTAGQRGNEHRRKSSDKSKRDRLFDRNKDRGRLRSRSRVSERKGSKNSRSKERRTGSGRSPRKTSKQKSRNEYARK